jgi:hypothetical protein
MAPNGSRAATSPLQSPFTIEEATLLLTDESLPESVDTEPNCPSLLQLNQRYLSVYLAREEVPDFIDTHNHILWPRIQIRSLQFDESDVAFYCLTCALEDKGRVIQNRVEHNNRR